jgi:anti-sigma B factor antagonist
MTAPARDPSSNELVTFDVSVVGTSATVRAAGEIDSTTAPLLSQHLTAQLDADVRELTVDLGEVTFLDSAGLCVLAAAHRRAGRQDVRLRVLATSRAVVRPLQITGLWDLLHAERVADAGRVA